MSGKVTLKVIKGPMQGQEFVFEEHDTFIFGRENECHACLGGDDMVSRRHFLVEVNPPDARLRDLGSLNGTYVNGIKYCSRAEGVASENGAKQQHPEVDLKHGDQIRVGQTELAVEIEVPGVCSECGAAIAEEERAQCTSAGNALLCPACHEKAKALADTELYEGPVRCQRCGKSAAGAVGNSSRGQYICETCRRKAENDPVELLRMFLAICAESEELPAIQGLEIGEALGSGGFGSVYRARRKKDDSEVAIKVMLPRVAVEEKARKLFLRETELAENLRHEHVVRFLDQGSAGDTFYFLMELCQGGSVADLVQQNVGKLSLSQAAPIMLQALEGLAFIHTQDVVHRDLKPGNILLAGPESDRVAKIGDFGLSKSFQKAGFSGYTFTGDRGGTYRFMPREQVINFKYVKPTCDVWSMAATFYHMLTGMLPYDFPRNVDPASVILNRPVVPIAKRGVRLAQRVVEVIDCALQAEPDGRYQNAQEMLDALRSALC